MNGLKVRVCVCNDDDDGGGEKIANEQPDDNGVMTEMVVVAVVVKILQTSNSRTVEVYCNGGEEITII